MGNIQSRNCKSSATIVLNLHAVAVLYNGSLGLSVPYFGTIRSQLSHPSFENISPSMTSASNESILTQNSFGWRSEVKALDAIDLVS
jgi:hypothetical protein